MNYYELLEVSPHASEAVIRAAYKSLMQRYHPDKNPGDETVAQRAALVVQAYEVLSDSGRRAAYDRELAQAGQVPEPRGAASRAGRPVRRPARRPASENRHGWLSWLLAAAAILAAWPLATPLKAFLFPVVETAPSYRPPPPPAPEADRAAAGAAADDAASPADPPPDAAAILKLLADVSVKLRKDAGHVLLIPAIGVRVGPLDTESAAKHLQNTTAEIRQKLLADLAEARYDELLKPDGEQYLMKLILASVRRASGTDMPEEEGSTNRYGAVDILLPDRYSLQ